MNSKRKAIIFLNVQESNAHMKAIQYLESALAIFEDLESGEDIGSTSITAHTATVMSNIGRVYLRVCLENLRSISLN